MSEELLLRRFDRYFAHPDRTPSVLRPKDRGVACANVRRALCILGHLETTFEDSKDADVFDQELWSAVREFQKARSHTRVDGLVGPITRRLIVSALLENEKAVVFDRLQRPDPVREVFISYAWKDGAKVNKLDQWLRDHGIRVIRDQNDFAPGETIADSIREAVAVCDKVFAVFSANSSLREWPMLEAFVAGELESVLGAKLLVYIRLDSTPLPERSAGRLHIDTREQPLRVVGQKLLQAVSGDPANPIGYEYDENLPL
jgi:TIR domain